jgi:hypothetical protein
MDTSLGAGLGVGITSGVFFALTVLGVASRLSIVVTDALLIAAFAGLAAYRNKRRQPDVPAEVAGPPAFRWNWILAIALAGGMAIVLAAMKVQADTNPHGYWDAWAIWNLRARFLAGPGESWRNALSPLLYRTHPDYPLLLSGFVARCWKFAGEYDTLAPITTALLFFLASAGLLISSLALLRRTSSGLLAGLAMLTGATYLEQPMLQFTDVPLGFYFLAVLAPMAMAWRIAGASKGRLMLMAGMGAACASWTKNEGLLFLALFTACAVLAELKFSGWRDAVPVSLRLALGLLPGLALRIWLKLLLPVAAQSTVPIPSLSEPLEPWRVWWMVDQVWEWVVRFGEAISHPVLILLVLVVALRLKWPARERGALWTGGGTLVLLFAGYCAITIKAYTPWDRFYSQFWPAFVFMAIACLRPIEELTSAPVPAPTGTQKGRAARKKRP